MSAFAILAELDGCDSKKKKPKAPKKVNTATTPAGPQRTPEQKAIIDRQHKERIALKAAKAAAKAEEEKCYFFAECGRKKQGDWNYCSACYMERAGKCGRCGGPTYFDSITPGKFHEFCSTCRKS